MSDTKRSGRSRLLVAAAVLAGIVAVDTLAWFVACRRLDDGARAEIAAAGWILSADPARWRGWPVAAEIVFPDATLRSGPGIVPPLAWSAGSQSLRLSPLSPTRLTIVAAGQQSLELLGAPPLPFTAGTLLATLDLTGRDQPRLDAADLSISAPAGPVRIAAAQLKPAADGLSLALAGLSLPGPDRHPVDPPIDDVHLKVHLSVPIVPMPTAAESASRWRADGGRLLVDAADLTWGPLAVTGTATIVLDPALQPDLTGTIAATGLLPGLDRLVAAGTLTASGALAARGMLAILSAPAGAGPVTLPIALRDGIVSLARIPLMRLAPMRWN